MTNKNTHFSLSRMDISSMCSHYRRYHVSHKKLRISFALVWRILFFLSKPIYSMTSTHIDETHPFIMRVICICSTFLLITSELYHCSKLWYIESKFFLQKFRFIIFDLKAHFSSFLTKSLIILSRRKKLT